MTVKILKNKMGYNCGCWNCGKEQEGRKAQPYIIWYKNDDEKRGHNLPICSQECIYKTLKSMAKIPNNIIEIKTGA